MPCDAAGGFPGQREVTVVYQFLDSMTLATVGLAGAYGLYTAAAVLSIVFVIRMVHETRGIELEDMQG